MSTAGEQLSVASAVLTNYEALAVVGNSLPSHSTKPDVKRATNKTTKEMLQ